MQTNSRGGIKFRKENKLETSFLSWNKPVPSMLSPAQRAYILFAVFLTGIHFLLAALIARIDPMASYGFWSGVKHGYFIVQNAIIGIFTGRLFWAPIHSSGYPWGVIAGSLLVPGMIKGAFEILAVIIECWRR